MQVITSIWLPSYQDSISQVSSHQKFFLSLRFFLPSGFFFLFYEISCVISATRDRYIKLISLSSSIIWDSGLFPINETGCTESLEWIISNLCFSNLTQRQAGGVPDMTYNTQRGIHPLHIHKQKRIN